uniref:Virion structural protein n=1 Tax=Erwinia phage Fifi051 TaxID=3238787 RepID=A0AB39ACI6_9CAUD
MNVEQLFTNLSYGELSNLSLSADGSGSIQEERQPRIILYANEGLLRLYSRFLLLEKDVLIEMVEHITNYHFLKKFTESHHDPESEHYPYIKDLIGEPYEEDMLKILAVYNSLGQKVPLNDNERIDSVFTPRDKLLQVPRPIDGASLSVLYQAKHPTLTIDDLQQEIILPVVLEGALTAYIAYKVFSHMNTDVSSQKAQEHIQIFNNICDEVEDRDMVGSSVATTNARFGKRGWV